MKPGRKRTRGQPSLDGFDSKVTRARAHEIALQAINRQINDDEVYQFRGEMHNGGLVHLYRVQYPPAPDHQWSAIIGDCVHNFRAALDYLATQLVLISGGTPSRHTAFPIMTSRPQTRRGLLGMLHRRGTEQATIGGGLRDDIRQLVDSIQPYQGTPLGQHLRRLHHLDIIDKHRQLLLAAMVPRAAAFDFDPSLHPLSSVQREYKRLFEITTEHDVPVLKIIFQEPVPRLIPTKLIVQVSFSRGENEAAGLDANQVLYDLGVSLDQVRALFAPFF